MKKKNFFWISYTDLMTSLFFIMMVLFVITVSVLKGRTKVLEEEKEVLETVYKNIEKLKDNSKLFEYDSIYKRYKLKFIVEFINDSSSISEGSLLNFDSTVKKLGDVGGGLKTIIDNLRELKKNDSSYRNISYMIIISGSASNIGPQDHNYFLSYNRAYNLYKFWRDGEQGIDFDAEEYHDLIDFQIAGNGIGGVGREEPENGNIYNTRNQRFIINVVPKIGEYSKTSSND